MKRMLINATQREELRVAIVDGQNLYDLDIEIPSKEQKKANIYKGRITRVEPSLEACFVEYGAERHGFLPLKEISRDYFAAGLNPNKAGIRELLKEGQEIVVQVEKEERGNKGAALTTFISLAGRYMVLMPNSPNAGGVSRRIEGEDRAEHQGSARPSAGARRHGPDRPHRRPRPRRRRAAMGPRLPAAAVEGDLRRRAVARSAPFLIYQESKLIIRALRDYLRNDVGEILIDNEELYNDAREFVQQVMPNNLRKLKLYKDTVPLFSRFQIETQIENAFDRSVRLPSGGSIVIDQTEALTAIDINSSKATKGDDIEETAFNTNCEAAGRSRAPVAPARPRRPDRDRLHRHGFAASPARCRGKTQGRAQARSRARADRPHFALRPARNVAPAPASEPRRIEPDRLPALRRPRPHPQRRIAVAVRLRLVEEQAMKDSTGQVLVQAPPDVANFLLNEKRRQLTEIEARHDVNVIVVADEKLETPHLEIQRLRGPEIGEEVRPSYQRTTPLAPTPLPQMLRPSEEPEQPAVSGVVRSTPAVPDPPPAAAPHAWLPAGGRLLARWAGSVGSCSGGGPLHQLPKNRRQRGGAAPPRRPQPARNTPARP